MKPTDNVTYWRDPEFAGIEICRVTGTRHVFPDHAHEDIYAIGLMERGGSYCLGPQKSDSLVAPGQLALINPGQVHSGVPYQGRRITYRMVYFSVDLMRAAVAEMSRESQPVLAFPRMVVDDAALWRRFQRLSRIMAGSGDRLERESAVMEALAGLVNRYGNVTTRRFPRRCGRRSIDRAMAFLAEALDRKISLESAARAAGLSRYHFLRVFKRETGLSPHLFRTLQRIDRAKQLLREGTALSETALAVGFSDQSHFSNTFRKYTGATPGQYLSESSGSRPAGGRLRKMLESMV